MDLGDGSPDGGGSLALPMTEVLLRLRCEFLGAVEMFWSGHRCSSYLVLSVTEVIPHTLTGRTSREPGMRKPGQRVTGLREWRFRMWPGSLQGLVQRAGQRYPAVQPGEAEQLADPRPDRDRIQAAAVGCGALGRADQCGEPCGVDKADLVQVGHQRAATGCQFAADKDSLGSCST